MAPDTYPAALTGTSASPGTPQPQHSSGPSIRQGLLVTCTLHATAAHMCTTLVSLVVYLAADYAITLVPVPPLISPRARTDAATLHLTDVRGTLIRHPEPRTHGPTESRGAEPLSCDDTAITLCASVGGASYAEGDAASRR